MLKIATITFILTQTISCTYFEDRAKLIQSSNEEAIGAKLILDENEQLLNKVLMKYKNYELDEGFKDPDTFLPSQHFFKSKKNIMESKVFKIIQRLPKGASLHSHDTALVSEEYLYGLTFKDDLYARFNAKKIQLRFFKEASVPPNQTWEKISWHRKTNNKFDAQLRSQLSLITDDPSRDYPSENTVWKKFSEIFETIQPLVCYKVVFEEYFYQALKELYEDNVRYLEFRGLLPQVYDLDGRIYNSEEVVGLYCETLRKFKISYPDFIGVKFIFAPSRKVARKVADGYVELFGRLMRNFPDFVVGFDLVGQEDLGFPLVNFVPELLELQNETKFFFHAGETDWLGSSTDLNLFDAVLLNTTRIGHGYAVLKHPKIHEIIKERGIALEISPISNQVLKLVDDLRNHPGSILISNGFPVVITNDDPSFWGAKGLSFDWYMAFMGLASRNDDLKLLKQLAMNSIKYSAMENEEKDAFMEKWRKEWERSVRSMVKDFWNLDRTN